MVELSCHRCPSKIRSAETAVRRPCVGPADCGAIASLPLCRHVKAHAAVTGRTGAEGEKGGTQAAAKRSENPAFYEYAMSTTRSSGFARTNDSVGESTGCFKATSAC